MQNLFYFQLLRFILMISLIIGCFILLKYTFIYLYPFLIATTIAFLLHPIVSFIELKANMKRGIATLLVMSSLFTLFFTFFFFMMKQLLKETNQLIENLPIYFNNFKAILLKIGQTYLIPFYEKVADTFAFIPHLNGIDIDTYVQPFFEQLSSTSSVLIKNFATTTSSFLTSLTYIATIFIFILISSFFISKEWNQLYFYYKEKIPVKIKHQISKIINQLKKSLFGFIKAQIIVTFITSIIVFVGLIIFQVDHIFIITLATFFVDFIPYLGIGIIFIPWIVYTFFTTNYVLAIQLSFLYIVIIIIRQVIEPRILASNIGIHPLFALIILFVGFQSLGIVGVFITPVILIIISTIYHAGIVHLLWNYIKSG